MIVRGMIASLGCLRIIADIFRPGNWSRLQGQSADNRGSYALNNLKEAKVALPTDDRFIDRAQEQLGVAFPPKYRAFLLGQNGGEIEPETLPDVVFEIYPVFDDSDRRRAARTGVDIVRTQGECRSWDGFPSEAVAIGDDGSGNFLLLLPDEGGVLGETIYLWDHETGECEELAPDLPSLELLEDY
ncbi:MAG: SMI1/KNR4 family protein [Actinomycetaceae bacterium]|nr:SMI1/KNR4 family protein [Actinomycetaceae bacterium]